MKKRIISAFLALATAISLSACNAKTEDVEANQAEITTKQEETKKAETTKKETTAEISNTEANETESESHKEDTAYWDEVCKEYDKTFNTTAHNAVIVEDVAYWQCCLPNAGNKFIIHDLATKETKFLDISNGVYFNGNIYGSFNQKNSSQPKNTIACFDIQGKLVTESKEIENWGSFYGFFINEDGRFVTLENGRHIGSYAISPDFSEIKQLILTVDIGHGKTEDVLDYSPICVYKNNLYVYNDYVEYVIDIKTGESKKLDYAIPHGKGNRGDSYQIGKYRINFEFETKNGFYNLETGELLSEISPNYFAGHSQFMHSFDKDDEGYIYTCIVPNNLSDFINTSSSDYLSNYVTYAKKYGKLVYTPELELRDDPIFLDDNHIFIKDNTGSYLINMKTGEETEIVCE